MHFKLSSYKVSNLFVMAFTWNYNNQVFFRNSAIFIDPTTHGNYSCRYTINLDITFFHFLSKILFTVRTQKAFPDNRTSTRLCGMLWLVSNANFRLLSSLKCLVCVTQRESVTSVASASALEVYFIFKNKTKKARGERGHCYDKLRNEISALKLSAL